jgi:hypothetical protein
MHMLGHVLLQIQKKVGIFKDQCSAKVLQLKLLWSNIIVDGIDRMTLIVAYIKYQFVALKLSIKPYLAQFTNQVLLIKVGIMNALHNLGQVGQQLLTTARQILQRALNLLKREH